MPFANRCEGSREKDRSCFIPPAEGVPSRQRCTTPERGLGGLGGGELWVRLGANLRVAQAKGSDSCEFRGRLTLFRARSRPISRTPGTPHLIPSRGSAYLIRRKVFRIAPRGSGDTRSSSTTFLTVTDFGGVVQKARKNTASPAIDRWHWPSGLLGWRRTFGAIKWLEQKAFGHFGRSIDESQKQGSPPKNQ